MNGEYIKDKLATRNPDMELEGAVKKSPLYLDFILLPKEERITYRYLVVNKKNNKIVLGAILYYVSWRKYVFMPKGETYFDTSCLMEIKAFIDKLMEERKKNDN